MSERVTKREQRLCVRLASGSRRRRRMQQARSRTQNAKFKRKAGEFRTGNSSLPVVLNTFWLRTDRLPLYLVLRNEGGWFPRIQCSRKPFPASPSVFRTRCIFRVSDGLLDFRRENRAAVFVRQNGRFVRTDLSGDIDDFGLIHAYERTDERHVRHVVDDVHALQRLAGYPPTLSPVPIARQWRFSASPAAMRIIIRRMSVIA